MGGFSFDGQSALDFAVNIGYEYDCRNIVVNKAAIGEDFFRLSTGVAGEVAQKFVNYGYRLAIIGDFSVYTSKPFRDYMYECNNGKGVDRSRRTLMANTATAWAMPTAARC